MAFKLSVLGIKVPKTVEFIPLFQCYSSVSVTYSHEERNPDRKKYLLYIKLFRAICWQYFFFFIYILHSCAEKYSSIHDQQKQQCNKCFEYRCIMYRNTWKETKLTQNIFLKITFPQEIKMRNVHRPMLATPSVEIYI